MILCIEWTTADEYDTTLHSTVDTVYHTVSAGNAAPVTPDSARVRGGWLDA